MALTSQNVKELKNRRFSPGSIFSNLFLSSLSRMARRKLSLNNEDQNPKKQAPVFRQVIHRNYVSKYTHSVNMRNKRNIKKEKRAITLLLETKRRTYDLCFTNNLRTMFILPQYGHLLVIAVTLFPQAEHS